jgi:hypothetical protein
VPKETFSTQQEAFKNKNVSSKCLQTPYDISYSHSRLIGDKHCYMHQMIGRLVNNGSERMYRTVVIAGFERLFWCLGLRG